MYFHLVSRGCLSRSCLSDTNTELIATYRAIRDNSKGVIEVLQKYEYEYKAYPPLSKEQEDYYYRLRDDVLSLSHLFSSVV